MTWVRSMLHASECVTPAAAPDRLEAIVLKTARRRQRRRINMAASALAVVGLVLAVSQLRGQQAEKRGGEDSSYEAPNVQIERGRFAARAGAAPRNLSSRAAGEPTQDRDAPVESQTTAESSAPVEPAVFKARTTVARLSADELLAEARRARGRRDTEAARHALLEVRARFSGTAAAGRATFLLGRVELDLANDEAAAATWFRRYVHEFPHGPLVAEARGRQLAHAVRTDVKNADALARVYLEHHADGDYAELARSVVE